MTNKERDGQTNRVKEKYTIIIHDKTYTHTKDWYKVCSIAQLQLIRENGNISENCRTKIWVKTMKNILYFCANCWVSDQNRLKYNYIRKCEWVSEWVNIHCSASVINKCLFHLFCGSGSDISKMTDPYPIVFRWSYLNLCHI